MPSPSDSKCPKQELFAGLFGQHQLRLYGYVFGLIRHASDAQDIVQQTAITAWQKFDDFDPATDFFRWTVTIAKYETLRFISYRRKSKIYFDGELMDQLGEDACDQDNNYVEAEVDALSQCVQKLNGDDARLIECRYQHELTSQQISELLDRTQQSVCNSLKRIRVNLARCIQRRLSDEGVL